MKYELGDYEKIPSNIDDLQELLLQPLSIKFLKKE